MKYELKKIDDADIRKIMRDYSQQKLIKGLPLVKKKDAYPSFWAVNSDGSSYLICMPSLVRDDSSDFSFLFFCGGNFYKVVLQGMFGDLASICGLVGDNVVDQEVKQLAISAFEIYGRWGSGSYNSDGVKEYFIKPEFE